MAWRYQTERLWRLPNHQPGRMSAIYPSSPSSPGRPSASAFRSSSALRRFHSAFRSNFARRAPSLSGHNKVAISWRVTTRRCKSSNTINSCARPCPQRTRSVTSIQRSEPVARNKRNSPSVWAHTPYPSRSAVASESSSEIRAWLSLELLNLLDSRQSAGSSPPFPLFSMIPILHPLDPAVSPREGRLAEYSCHGISLIPQHPSG